MLQREDSTIRSQLTRLVITCVLPVWLAAGFFVFHAYSTKRNQVVSHMQDTAQAMTMVVDRELSSVRAALQALATSPSFANDDFAGVHRQAVELLKSYPGADIIVADASGQQLVNSYRSFGEPLPKRKSPETLARIFATGQPVVSNLFFGAVTKRGMVGIDMPVFRDGKVAYDLAMTFPCDRLGVLLSSLVLPKDWYVSLLDGKQVLVARTRKPEIYVGTKASAGLRQVMMHKVQGSTEQINLEGDHVFSTFNRSALSNWTVVIGVPKAAVMAEIYQWMGWAVGGASTISLIGIFLAVGIARGIAREIQALVATALAIGRGESITGIGDLRVKESREVASALVQASELLQQRSEQRDAAERELFTTIDLLQVETAERLRASEELMEKERLLIQQSRQAAMGEMIGNIAHQWRQPLNTLGLTIQKLELFHNLGQFSAELLQESVGSSMQLIQHMSQTIEDFSSYFRPDKEKVDFSVSEAVAHTLSLIEASFKNEHIEIELIQKDDPFINGYHNEFAQVLLNILINARDALKENQSALPKVIITITGEDRRAVVTVADNAGGIPAEIMGKIFDPYFTTKGPQHGTGVGLFMSKTIIEKNMGGSLTVSNLPHGAQFRIAV